MFVGKFPTLWIMENLYIIFYDQHINVAWLIQNAFQQGINE
jgi:hypothetical protein